MTKTSTLRSALGALALGAGLAGCVDFTGPGLDQNPNVPTAAKPAQLFPAIQAFQQASTLGDETRFVSIWMQSMMGINRQFSSIARYQLYDENLLGWTNYYTGGGLVDLRLIQTQSAAANDRIFLGIAQTYEAMIMDQAADNWGSIIYKDAGRLQAVQPNVPLPRLERQDSVYADLQILLDSAITNLASGTGAGPGTADLVYGGNATRWIAMAHTLKARIALHQRNYTLARDEALLGISAPANDYRSYQSSGIGEENQWFQFRRNRGTDMSAGDTLVKLLIARADPRRTQYFELNGAGVVKGAKPGDEDDGTFSWLSASRGAPGFRQPMVTYDETQLILAEARTRLPTPDFPGALAALQAYKTTNGITFNFATPTTGGALQNEIMTEKYIAMQPHIESWNDYKRTCTPNLTPNPTAVSPQTKIPMRFIYPLGERQTNPDNIKAPGTYGARNLVDGTTPPTPYSGGTCLGQ